MTGRSRSRGPGSRRSPRRGSCPRIPPSAGALITTVGLVAVTLRHVITLAAVVTCALLAGLAVFQVLLVAGRPLGRFAWGGQHEVLPRTLRASSAVSVVLYAVIAWFVWRAAAEPETAGPWIWVLTAFFALGVVMNAASRSRPERLVMTPVVLVLAVSCLLIALG